MRKFLLVILLTSFFYCFSQNETEKTILSYNDFISLVKQNHPVARQAEIQISRGEANLLQARGGFDPKIEADFSQKYFKDKEYYELGEGKLKVPTWFGIELQGGYERNEGQFLNPENNVPTAGLWFAGISVPVGEGLFIDERRAELRKAQAMLTQTNAERDILLNQIVLDAGVAYWEWFKAFHSYKVYQNGYELAKQRFDAVKQSAQLGDLPTIDTLESGIQVQNRQLSLAEAELELMNSKALLSIYLWSENYIPLELTDSTTPEALVLPSKAVFQQFENDFDSLLINHPELRATEAKIEQLEIDRRWASEQLKPTLNLMYKPITEAIDNDPLAEYSVNNYTWGLQFEFPIFLRKERGKLNLVKLKLEENQLGFKDKIQSVRFKAQSAYNEYTITKDQMEISSQNALDYESLLKGEQRLFDGGESSLFLVNSRETGFIKSQNKLIEIISKNQKAILKTNYALGNLGR